MEKAIVRADQGTDKGLVAALKRTGCKRTHVNAAMKAFAVKRQRVWWGYKTV